MTETTSPDDEHCKPFVSESLDSKTLYFSISAIQSRMDLRRPDALALDYTRTMAGFVALHPAPEHLGMVGLGGGSLAKWCHRHLPRSTLTVVEINPHVIALRDSFLVPPDDSRFQVVCDDGAQFVAQTPQRFDVLLVDAFDVEGTPPALVTQRFFDDCLDVLRPGGLLVVNLHANVHEGPVVERIRRSCEGHLLRVGEPDGCNTVVFARKGQPVPHGPLARPKGLGAEAWAELAPAISRIGHALAEA